MSGSPTRRAVAVVGAGAAGMSAAIHAARRGADVTLIDPLGPGGQLQNAGVVDTFPGVVAVSGPELAANMTKQLDGLGVRVELCSATRVRRQGDGFTIGVDDGRRLEADAVIVATGSAPRPAGVPGEAELEHKGVSHCAVCDGPLSKGLPAVVIGGGDAAADSALALAEVCSSVTMVHRGGQLDAVDTLARRLDATPNITCLFDTEVVSIDGDKHVEAVTVRTPEGAERRIEANAVFVAVGVDVNTAVAGDLVDRDDERRVIVDVHLMARTPGIFAAGSARSSSSEQLAGAVGDGVAAAVSADRWLRGELGTPVRPVDDRVAHAGASFADYEKFFEHALQAGPSDGLPVVPLTPGRLDRFLAELSLAAEEPVGALPDGSVITCADALTHAVIAGCRPDYGPLVLAAIGALLASPARTESVIADSAQVIVVNGPARLPIDLNCSDGLVGPGWRANATIGRALRLFATNRLGVPPASGFGDPGQYTMCFGEDEEKSPWTPLHVSRGLPSDASAVTLFTAPVYRQVMDRRHTDAAGIVEFISLFMRGKASGTALFGDAPVSLMVVIGQELRRLLVSDYSKERLRDDLFDRITADDGVPLHPVNVASPDDLLIVAAGGVAFPTVWVYTSTAAPTTVEIKLGVHVRESSAA